MRSHCQFTVKRSAVPPKCAVMSTTAATATAATAAATATATAAKAAATTPTAATI